MAICLAFSICLKAVWLKRFDSVTSVPHVETVISEMDISREIMRDIFNNNLADANLLCNVRLYRLNVLASAYLLKKSRVKTSRVSNRIPTWTGNKSLNAGKRDLTIRPHHLPIGLRPLIRGSTCGNEITVIAWCNPSTRIPVLARPLRLTRQIFQTDSPKPRAVHAEGALSSFREEKETDKRSFA